MQEAAKTFGATAGVTVNVTAGPLSQWVDKAKADADVIFSGAESMMSDFAKALPGAFDLKEAYPLYLRPVAILVRPGNPKNIRGLRDLLAPGIKVLTVAGAGQVGLWEDVAGRTGDIELVRALRRNIVFPEAVNSGAAKEQWTQQADLDAWLIWQDRAAGSRLHRIPQIRAGAAHFHEVGLAGPQGRHAGQPPTGHVDGRA